MPYIIDYKQSIYNIEINKQCQLKLIINYLIVNRFSFICYLNADKMISFPLELRHCKQGCGVEIGGM